MTPAFLANLLQLRRGFVATVLQVEGHAYKPQGHRALYEVDAIRPSHGNLGSLCVDQEILRQGAQVVREARPRSVDFDHSDARASEVGHGAFCGGRTQILLEPLGAAQLEIYAVLQERLEAGEPARLAHDPASGELRLDEAPDAWWVEEIRPARRAVLFGATPLAERVLRVIDEMPLRLLLVDWRPAHLKAIACAPHVRRAESLGELSPRDLVLVLSHDLRRDLKALRTALDANCSYIGLLGSTARREQILSELPGARGRIRCPIGLPLGGRGDAEIALSIGSELVRVLL